MPYYIRKGNEIYKDQQSGNHLWSPITGETSRLIVSSFTTRSDANKYVLENFTQEEYKSLLISNNLEYDK